MHTLNPVEQLTILEKQVQKRIEEDTRRLLAKGYTFEDLKLLDEALDYMAYPIISEYFDKSGLKLK